MRKDEDRYYHTLLTAQEYIQLAQGYDGKHLIEKLLTFLAPKSTLLELGMGPGIDMDILSTIYDTTGSDLSLVFLTLYQKKNPHAKLLRLDAVDLETDQRFEGIYSNKVLHHLTKEDFKKSLENQTKILCPSGIVCHSFWRGTTIESMHGLTFHYYTQEMLRSVFDEHFDVLFLEEYQEMDARDSLVVIARKKIS